MLRLGGGSAVEAGGGGAGLHDGTDDAHHCLKPGEGKPEIKKTILCE